jgi:trimethylamine--corrinoid protein Co-methyltransferase
MPVGDKQTEEWDVTTPCLRLLSHEDLQRIHETSLRILDEIGMIVDHPDALEFLDGAGARVDRATRRVRFPPELVERCLTLVPRAYSYHGRTPQQDFTVTVDGDVYARVPGGAPGYVDLETGEFRRARIADWREFAIIEDALPNIHAIATLHCGDVPLQTADLHSLRTLLLHQRKCVVHNAFSVENLHAIYELAIAVRGTQEALVERPLVHLQASPISPLYLNADDLGQILYAVEMGLPLDLPIMPIAGISGPITLAGTIAQANAEYLATMTLVQVKGPNHPMAYFMDPVVPDMRSGNPLMGAPECGLLVAGISQLGTELYGLPTQALGMAPDGYTLGQAMHQKTQVAMFQVLSGGRLVVGPGSVETTMALSPVQLVIDDELIAIARRWERGITVNDETLGFDALARVGPRGDFLADDHTLAHLRSGELMSLALAERERRGVWETTGRHTLESRARDKARTILATHEVEPLPDHVVAELDDIVRRADARAV